MWEYMCLYIMVCVNAGMCVHRRHAHMQCEYTTCAYIMRVQMFICMSVYVLVSCQALLDRYSIRFPDLLPWESWCSGQHPVLHPVLYYIIGYYKLV